jgi:hypothetical protein
MLIEVTHLRQRKHERGDVLATPTKSIRAATILELAAMKTPTPIHPNPYPLLALLPQSVDEQHIPHAT